MKIFRNLKQLSPSVKASIAFFVSGVFVKGISYLVTPVYTRLLSTAEYGRVSVYLTWMDIFGIIAMFCFANGIFNNGMLDYKEKRDDFSFSILCLSNIVTLCFAGLFFCFYPLFRSALNIDIPLLILMFVIFLFQPAYAFWSARQRYELKYKGILFFSIFMAIASPTVAIITMLFSNEGERLYPRLFGAECPLILFYIGFYLYLGFKNKWKVNKTYWKQALLFNLPLIPHYLSAYLLNSSDKIMISYLISDTATAYYSVAHSIAAVATIVWTAINGSLIPYTYEKCKEQKYDDINKVTLPLLSLFAVGCVMVILLAPEAVQIMATSDYYEAVYVIPPIVGGVFFQVQYYIYANVVYYHKKPLYIMIGSITAMVANIILNLIFIPQFGYIAAGYTTIVCYALQAVIDFFAMRRIAKTNVYNMKFIFLLSIIVVAVAIFSNLIYDYMIVRFSIFGVLIILGLIFWKKILSFFAFRSKDALTETDISKTIE